ncbi:hypothetical protein NMY22_g3828 [Coprinellus aureogranulatus]|nr:hypothetical protein NMY22_g3828 [Coprinellus aureogranulatus]
MTSTLQTPSKRPRGEETPGNTLFEHSGPRLGINNLHYEILGEVFRLSLSDLQPRVQGELYQLMVVCQQWKDVCLSTHHLWSSLSFYLSGEEAEEQEVIRRCKLWFSRAGGLGLCVDLFIQGWDYHNRVNGLPVLDKLKDLWSYLASLSRLRSIHLRGFELVSISDWFNQSWPPLTNLVIDVSKRSIPQFGLGRALQDYDNTAITTANYMLSALKCNAIGNSMGLRNLTSLTLHAYLSAYFVLALVEEAQGLKVLDVDLHPKGYRSPLETGEENKAVWKKLQEGKTISLPGLRDVRLANITGQEELVEHLRIPQCQILSVNDPGISSLTPLQECLQGSSTTLEQVRLRLLQVDDNRLLGFLRDYPCIDTLALHRLERVDGSFLADLSLDENAVVLRKLRSFDIKGNWKRFNTDALVRFIKSKGVTFRAKALKREDKAVDLDGSLEWLLFQDWLYPELFVRYDAHDTSVKLLRTVKVDKHYNSETDEVEE